jgi:hypothetical protein
VYTILNSKYTRLLGLHHGFPSSIVDATALHRWPPPPCTDRSRGGVRVQVSPAVSWLDERTYGRYARPVTLRGFLRILILDHNESRHARGTACVSTRVACTSVDVVQTSDSTSDSTSRRGQHTRGAVGGRSAGGRRAARVRRVPTAAGSERRGVPSLTRPVGAVRRVAWVRVPHCHTTNVRPTDRARRPQTIRSTRFLRDSYAILPSE